MLHTFFKNQNRLTLIPIARVVIILTFIFSCANSTNNQNLEIDQDLMEFYSEIGVIHNALLDDNNDYRKSIENNGTDVNFKTISKEEAYDLTFIEVKNNMSENYNFNHEELLVNAKDLAFDRFYDIAALKMQKSKRNAFASDFEQVILDLERDDLVPSYA